LFHNLILWQFIEEKYKLEMTGLQTSQLNRAISTGAEEGIFSLPKGPSGKVKLASKNKTSPAKEVSYTSIILIFPSIIKPTFRMPSLHLPNL
jgi:hypothetical protein